MTTVAATVEKLFDRPPAAVRTRRRSRLRTAATLLLLVGLSAIIFAYAYVTDSERVRALSEKFLSQIVGGQVEVGHASLSIFEGLRLDDVRMFTSPHAAGSTRDDNLLFEARSLIVGYNPRALIVGRIEATRILALEPHVRLVENLDENIWNFQTLDRSGHAANQQESSAAMTRIALPEVLLRNAKVDYWQVAGGRRSQVGTLALEGQLTPDAGNLYRFRLQSRGGNNTGMFPIAEGWLAAGGDSMGVTLRDVEFVDELKTILPAAVRNFWEDHRLAGRIGETRVSYFKKPDGRAGFKVETDLDGVRLIVPPQQWLGPVERERAEAWRSAFAMLASPAMGGSPVAQILMPAMTPRALQLDEVDGTFVFTDTQITVKDLVARAEANRFKISGAAEGYDAAAPFKLRVQSLGSQDVVIPESPTYITALPWPVQEIYYRFAPRGAVGFWVDIERKLAGGRFTLDGELSIHDAGFRYEKLPYPIDRVSGKLRIGTDASTGRELLEIVELTGRGYAGGANAAATVHVSGRISPLDETAGADIVIRGTGIRNDPQLLAALPPPARRGVAAFDAHATGALPTFEADFLTTIHCPVGRGLKSIDTTTLDVRNAAGIPCGFNYPLKGVAARLVIHEDSIDIEHVTFAPGGGTAKLTGAFTLGKARPDGERAVTPDLRLTADGIAIDESLIAALPPKVATKLRDAGLSGLLDLDGTIKAGAGDDDLAIDFDATLKSAAATFGGGSFAFDQLTATAKLTQNAVTIPRFDARYGKASVQGNAAFDWDGVKPGNAMAARIEALPIDAALIAKLPERVRPMLQSLRLAGTVDADVQADADTFRAVVKPRQLSLSPEKFPLRITDVGGEIVIEPAAVTLRDTTARVGNALLRTSGTIDAKTGAADVSLSARSITVEPSVVATLPAAVRRVIDETKLKGTFAVDVPRLRFVPASGVGETLVPAMADLAATLWLENASMQIGAAVDDAHGVIKLTAATRGNRIATLGGEVHLDRLKLADRPITQLTAVLNKPEGRDVLQVGRIRGGIADGEIAGQIDTLVSERDQRFGLSLILRNAKVAELTGETDKPIDGRLTASLQLEGRWDDPASRRGRGDVIVEGREMYRVPVVFGLMQMATLAVPIDSFNRAGLRYSVQGQKVNLETIDLRSKDKLMQGNGWIDFDKKTVSMNLATSGGAAESVPIFGDLIRGARQDLLQVRVRGTLQEPSVGASSFNIFRTTIDEVMKGD